MKPPKHPGSHGLPPAKESRLLQFRPPLRTIWRDSRQRVARRGQGRERRPDHSACDPRLERVVRTEAARPALGTPTSTELLASLDALTIARRERLAAASREIPVLYVITLIAGPYSAHCECLRADIPVQPAYFTPCCRACRCGRVQPGVAVCARPRRGTVRSS